MLFSKSIAVFATLAFGAISSLAAPVVDNTAIVARCDACDAQKGVAGILIDVKAAVGVYVEEMKYIKKENCTAEVIEPLIAGIKVGVNDGLVKINALVGASADVILAGAVDVDVKVDVHVLAGIVADLIVYIFTGIKVILDLNVAACLSVVIPLFCALGEVIGALICAVLSICGHLLIGLDVAILALIQVVVSIIVRLNVSVLISVFGIVL